MRVFHFRLKTVTINAELFYAVMSNVSSDVISVHFEFAIKVTNSINFSKCHTIVMKF